MHQHTAYRLCLCLVMSHLPPPDSKLTDRGPNESHLPKGDVLAAHSVPKAATGQCVILAQKRHHLRPRTPSASAAAP